MAVYLISDVIVHDNEAVEKYRELAADSIEKWGGRYLVRGVRSMLWKAIGTPLRSLL
jgi:uncharacterized protein (DUF1330 family)